MAAADGPITAIYQVKYLLGADTRLRRSTVTLTENYTTFEDIRKIIVTRLIGNPKQVDKIDILSVTKTWGKPSPAPANGV